jgi:hypothetical protein
VSFAAITLCVASQRVLTVATDFVIDSVRKLLDTPSYLKILSRYSPGGYEETHGTSDMIVGILAMIRTQNLSNMSEELPLR